MKNFLNGTAVYLDYMVSTPIFQHAIPAIAMSNPMLFNAITACGAYNLGRKIGNMDPIQAAAEYYKKANSMLYVSLQSKEKDLELCLATALLITVYEMGFEVANDLTSHISGVKRLLEEFPVYYDTIDREMKFSSPIAQGAFWVLLHCDILTAFLLRSVPLWNPNDWGPLVGIGDTSYYDLKYPDPTKSINKTRPSLDKTKRKHLESKQSHFWYRKTLYILYRTCLLRGLGYDPTSATQFESMDCYLSARQTLYDELQEMLDQMPMHMGPLFDINDHKDSSNREIRHAMGISPNIQQNNFNLFNAMEKDYPSVSKLYSNDEKMYKHHISTEGERKSRHLHNLFGTTQKALLETNDQLWIPNEGLKNAFDGSYPPTLSQIFFPNPINAVVHAYMTSAMLALHNLKPGWEAVDQFNVTQATSCIGQEMSRQAPLTTRINKRKIRYQDRLHSMAIKSTESLSFSSRKHTTPSFSMVNSGNGSYSQLIGELSTSPEPIELSSRRVVIEFQDCQQEARRLVSIIISSSHNFQIGCMMAWGFLFAQPYISNRQEQKYIIEYFDRLCITGWSIDRIKLLIKERWE